MTGSLLDLARSQPVRALEEVAILLSKNPLDPGTLAALNRVSGQAHSIIGDYTLAAESYSVAMSHAASDNDNALEARIAISLAGAQFDSGQPELAYQTLDRVDQAAKGELLGISLGQRGGLLVDQGRLDDALAAFKRATVLLQSLDDKYPLVTNLMNIGNLQTETSDLDSAVVSYQRARALFEELGMTASVAATIHNLARVAGRQGDLIGALNSFEEAELYHVKTEGVRSHMGADRCEVLIQAGLFDSAIEEASQLLAFSTRTSDQRQIGFAHYLLATAYLLTGDKTRAVPEAIAANRIFEEGTSGVLAGLAKLVELECLDPNQGSADEALALAKRFESSGNRVAQIRAIAISCSHSPSLNAADQKTLSDGLGDPRSEIRRACLIGLAKVLRASGAEEEAFELIKTALADVAGLVGMQSSTSVRRSMATHLTEIQSLGNSILTARGNGRDLERWIDRSRSVSATLPPLRPSPNAELAKLVSELRATQQDEGQPDTTSIANLESKIATRAALSAGNLEATRGSDTALEPERNTTIVRFYSDQDLLYRVDTTSSTSSLVPVGDTRKISSSMSLLGADLRRMAREPGNDKLQHLITRSVDKLGAILLPRTQNSLVINPPSQFLSFAWSALAAPNQSIVVTPSLSYWGRTHRPNNGATAGMTAIAGPGLTHATSEVIAVGQTTPGSLEVFDASSTVARAIEALSSDDVVHLACHGSHHRSNPRFSALRMYDGQLFAHDIEQIESTARLVVLTSCDTGMEKELAGGEAMGIGTALLTRGTKTVIASSTLVPDSGLLTRFATNLHTRLQNGSRPGLALSLARSEAAQDEAQSLLLSGFTCLGWG